MIVFIYFLKLDAVILADLIEINFLSSAPRQPQVKIEISNYIIIRYYVLSSHEQDIYYVWRIEPTNSWLKKNTNNNNYN